MNRMAVQLEVEIGTRPTEWLNVVVQGLPGAQRGQGVGVAPTAAVLSLGMAE